MLCQSFHTSASHPRGADPFCKVQSGTYAHLLLLTRCSHARGTPSQMARLSHRGSTRSFSTSATPEVVVGHPRKEAGEEEGCGGEGISVDSTDDPADWVLFHAPSPPLLVTDGGFVAPVWHSLICSPGTLTPSIFVRDLTANPAGIRISLLRPSTKWGGLADPQTCRPAEWSNAQQSCEAMRSTQGFA